MDFLEKVEKLRDKAGISYEEAKDILTDNDGDLLDAMIRLEKEGRIAPPPPTGQESSPKNGHIFSNESDSFENRRRQDDSSGSDVWKGFWRYVKTLIKKGNRNTLKINKGDNVVAAIPVTVFVAAVIFAFWATVPLMIIGLFVGCSYSFAGPDLEKENINRAWDKASQMAENIKEDIKKEMDKK